MEMELAKLTSKGQLTLPVAIRKKLGLEKGGRVVFLVDGNGVRIANAENLTVTEKPLLMTAYTSKRRSVPGQKPKGK